MSAADNHEMFSRRHAVEHAGGVVDEFLQADGAHGGGSLPNGRWSTELTSERGVKPEARGSGVVWPSLRHLEGVDSL
jgi:hypothetical protein